MLSPLLIIVLLVILNALFATGELALISARKARLENMMLSGVKGAEAALKLTAMPQNFLPTVQVGMTLVSILEGAFGGNAIEATVKEWLIHIPYIAPFADKLSMIVVVAAITFIMIVFGELVPKQIALQNPETIAIKLSPFLKTVDYIANPIIWFLKKVSSFVLYLMRIQPNERVSLTEEELRAVLVDGTRSGVLERDEKEMIERLLSLADRPVSAIMTPRSEIFWVDKSADHKVLVNSLLESPYSRVLVCDGDIDHPIGVIVAKDILNNFLRGKTFSIESVLKKPPVIPDSLSAQGMVERFREISLGILFILDEYGSFEGIVTASDVFEAIVGEDGQDDWCERYEKNANGESYDFEGDMPADEVALRLNISSFPERGTYHTIGGVIMALLRRVPTVGDKVIYKGWQFEILKMERRRVLLLRASRDLLTKTN